MKSVLQCGRFELNLKRPLVMGIVNVTPDSFSDGDQHFSPDDAIAHGVALFNQGANLLDIGGESTRPGAQPVSLAEEARRILPVIEGLRKLNVPLSVDTFKPQIMKQALDAGADMINDIYGFRHPDALAAVASSQCGLCVMHMQGEPKTMQQAPVYTDVVLEVQSFLRARVNALQSAGVASNRIVLDPGFGFGKTMAQNYQLLGEFSKLMFDHYAWLVGVSRKSMIGHVTGGEPQDRLAGSIAAALAGVSRGAHILRVHDVKPTVDAIKVWSATEYGIK